MQPHCCITPTATAIRWKADIRTAAASRYSRNALSPGVFCSPIQCKQEAFNKCLPFVFVLRHNLKFAIPFPESTISFPNMSPATVQKIAPYQKFRFHATRLTTSSPRPSAGVKTDNSKKINQRRVSIRYNESTYTSRSSLYRNTSGHIAPNRQFRTTDRSAPRQAPSKYAPV